jgi:hypothetical protein
LYLWQQKIISNYLTGATQGFPRQISSLDVDDAPEEVLIEGSFLYCPNHILDKGIPSEFTNENYF